MNLSELKIYLPKYLSAESEKELFSCLNDFPHNIDERMYTSYLKKEKLIFQGDCINDIPIVDIETLKKKEVTSIVLSNTCDIDSENKRNFPSNIILSPLIRLENYIKMLIDKSIDKRKLDDHIKAIKKQRVTQIFYLPKYSNELEESIVFFDRLSNIPNHLIDLETLETRRVISLGDYGSYLFLYKISMHFTRIQDKVERRSISI